VDGQVRGYVDAVLQPWLEAVWIANMAVHPDFRRRGIGTALVRRARQWAKGLALQSLVVELTTKNYPALSFCRKFGFEFCGFNDHYYTNQDIALFFVQTFR
jgi:ribosomal protein S18 acetylase RimI-like enzyme